MKATFRGFLGGLRGNASTQEGSMSTDLHMDLIFTPFVGHATTRAVEILSRH